MLHGLSTRRYRYGLEPVGEDLGTGGTSKSTVGRRFIEGTRKALADLTVARLGVPGPLRRSLQSTNAIESAFDKVRVTTRNVKHWRHGEQVLRWCASGLLEAEKGFRRIKGYRKLPALAAALSTLTLPTSSSTVKTA